MIETFGKKNKKYFSFGFSVAEILTVSAIIIIILLITAPIIKNYLNNLDLTNSTKLLISNLKLAQQYTVTQQLKHAIRMDIYSHTFYLVKKEPSEEILQTLNLDEKVIFESFTGIENNEVVYNPAGAVDFTGEINLKHQITSNQTKVYIKPSGYVTWENLSP